MTFNCSTMLNVLLNLFHISIFAVDKLIVIALDSTPFGYTSCYDDIALMFPSINLHEIAMKKKCNKAISRNIMVRHNKYEHISNNEHLKLEEARNPTENTVKKKVCNSP